MNEELGGSEFDKFLVLVTFIVSVIKFNIFMLRLELNDL